MESSLLQLVLALVFGVVLLFFGMQLFWLYVGIAGFALGFAIGAVATGSTASWVTLVAALGGGVVFAALAIVLRKPMAAIAGFFAAGGAALAFLDFWMDAPAWGSWAVFLVFAIPGAIAVWWMFVPAIIFITSFAGASGIVNALESRLDWSGLVFMAIWLVLVAAGLVVQFRSRRRHLERKSEMRVMGGG